MEEFCRVLKPSATALIITPGATALIIAPYRTSAGAVQDPTHKWPPIAEQPYLHFNAGARRALQFGHCDIHCDFDAASGDGIAPEFRHLSPQEQAFASKHCFNVMLEPHAPWRGAEPHAAAAQRLSRASVMMATPPRITAMPTMSSACTRVAAGTGVRE